MKRLVLHIGTHKTGTTALQNYLYDNAAGILEQGFCYPKTKSKFFMTAVERNAHFLVRYTQRILDPDVITDEMSEQIDANLESFRKNLSKNDTVILSDERLWYLGRQYDRAWQVLKELFGELGIEAVDIIVYVRRQDLFINSFWNQHVKDSIRLRTSLEEFSQRPKIQTMVDYYTGVEVLAEEFGKEHVTVRPYERQQLVNGDMVSDFCQLVGIEMKPEYVSRPGDSNPGMTGIVTAIKMQANRMESYRETDNFLREVAVETSLASKSVDATSYLTRAMSARLLEPFLEGNERIAREYLGREDGKLFLDAPVPRSKEPSFDTKASTRDVIRFFTVAIAQEHTARLEAETKLAELQERLDMLEMQMGTLQKRSNQASRRLDGLNASLGPLSRFRRRLWRSKQQ